MNAYDIIKRPLITEKSNLQKEKHNQFVFVVSRDANRIQIKQAVEEIFKVSVTGVRTSRTKGKIKRRGQVLGKRKDWKKAVVSIMPGERIEFFEGV
jgi:large subunit ribosomal protein L23